MACAGFHTVKESDLMAVSKENQFRQDFPEIITEIDAAGDHEWILVDEYVTRIGVGLQTTVIVKNLETGKGWGLVWRIDAKRLEGMRGNVYHAEHRDSSSSQAFMETFRKRLQSEAATLAAITSGPVSFRADHHRHLKAEIKRRCY